MRFFDMVSKDCWVWKGSTKPRNGYGHFVSQGKDWNAHRFSWTLHNGPIPDGMHVLHTCDVPACVNPAHLRLGTHKENMDDMTKKGRRVIASRPKLTEDEVRQIRREFKWISQRKSNSGELAKRYKVETITIVNAALGRTWSHVK